MPWVRLDDHFDDHKKVEPLSDSAFRTFVESLCYSNRNLTDGFVEADVAKKRWPRKAINELMARDLWEQAEGGYQVHDYAQYQLTSEQILAERAAARERMKELRGQRTKRHRSGERSGEHNDEQQPKFKRSSGTPTPTPNVLSEHPDPERARARSEADGDQAIAEAQAAARALDEEWRRKREEATRDA